MYVTLLVGIEDYCGNFHPLREEIEFQLEPPGRKFEIQGHGSGAAYVFSRFTPHLIPHTT